MSRCLAVVVLLLTTALPAAGLAAERAERPLAEGLALHAPAGERLDLARFAGRVVLVNFWASWCLPCRYEMPLLQKLHDRFNSRGLDVLAIAIDDDLEPVREYLDPRAFTFAVAYDGEGLSKPVFGIDSVPETYVVGRDGRLLAFTDPRSGVAAVRISDPTVWEGPAIVEFLERALGP